MGNIILQKMGTKKRKIIAHKLIKENQMDKI